MKNDTIILRPYHSCLVALPLLIFTEIGGFALGGSLLSIDLKSTMILFLLGIIAVIFHIYIQIISHTVIYFDDDSIRIYEEIFKKDRCFSWKDFSFVYFDNNFKGHHYSIFSKNELDKDVRRKLLWLYEYSSKYNDILVFPANSSSANKSVYPLRELLYKKEENKEIVLHKTSRNYSKF